MNKLSESSRFSKFYELDLEERLEEVKKFSDLSEEEADIIKKTGALELDNADNMIENTIGTQELPLGIAVNFKINGKDFLIPMCIEESSVIAAASNAAKKARKTGGFKTESTSPKMIGQIQLTDLNDIEKAEKKIKREEETILKLANQESSLKERGGGAEEIKTRTIETDSGEMLIVHLIIDTRDAMGANVVNTMVESISPTIEEITGGEVILRILSNLADKRIAKAKATFSKAELGGEKIVDRIIKANQFAKADPYRCATHNKGIMNGIEAVALATGNDTRALEAGAHGFAAKNGSYQPLTSWKKDEEGNLKGMIEVPVPVGIIGGATETNPIAKICLKILDIDSSQELGEIMAAVGLAQNLAALRALASEGIQEGHMRLHARNIATMAGAEGDMIDKVAQKLIDEENISQTRASEILEEISGNG